MSEPLEELTTLDGFLVSSIYGHHTHEPLVNMTYGPGDFHVQMRPGDAVHLGLSLIRVAEASIGDAFLIEFLHTRVGAADHVVAGILEDFRQWRSTKGLDKEASVGG